MPILGQQKKRKFRSQIPTDLVKNLVQSYPNLPTYSAEKTRAIDIEPNKKKLSQGVKSCGSEVDLAKICKQFKQIRSTFFRHNKSLSLSSKSVSSGPIKGSVADELSYNNENHLEDDSIDVR